MTSDLTSNDKPRYLTLNLFLRDDGGINVRSCEVVGPGFRNRTSFQGKSELDHVLVSELSGAISSCLDKIKDGSRALSLPDFVVEMPGLILAGVRVFVSLAVDGVKNVIFRFLEFVGGINHAFKASVGLEMSATSQMERLAMNILSDLCLPLLNLCKAAELAQIGDNSRMCKYLVERANEVEFQAELLKRFVFNSSEPERVAISSSSDSRRRSRPLQRSAQNQVLHEDGEILTDQ
ncbi:hypothetical protein [Amaricoccus tamworthensis]|uniref:hypothetical protein n=1 Tax=Amaricoccus tamworthensis TaxID=57002 RepID=UPI003C7AA8C4